MSERLPELQITSLRVNEYRGAKSDVPYLVINATFKIDPDTSLWQMAKGESEEYAQRLTIDDPEKYEQWVMRESWDLKDRYEGYGRAWVPQDVPWRYLEKFDTFWFREWVADCGVTRAAIAELEYYKEHGTLASEHRSTHEYTVLRYLRCLESFWD